MVGDSCALAGRGRVLFGYTHLVALEMWPLGVGNEWVGQVKEPLGDGNNVWVPEKVPCSVMVPEKLP